MAKGSVIPVANGGAEKKNKIRLIPVCVALLVLVVLLGTCGSDSDEPVTEPAETFDELEVYVRYAAGTEAVRVWYGDGSWYVFLPSGAEEYRLTFGNLGDGDTVELDGTAYTNEDNIAETIEFDRRYSCRVCLGGQWLDGLTVVFCCSAQLPAVFIDTASGTTDAIHADLEAREAADVRIFNGTGRQEYNETIEYIKCRGNSTFWDYEKKPYLLKLTAKASLLGMPAAKKWVLLANTLDPTLMRNALVYDYTAEYTDVASVEGEFVDLYINGEYVGNYYLCEKIDVSSSMVDITDLDELNSAVNAEDALENNETYVSEDGNIRAVSGLDNPEDITGGYLVEKVRDADYAEARCGFRTDSGVTYELVSPSNASVEQVEYICGVFNELEAAIRSEDGVNPETGKHISEYLDMDSWVSRYLIDEGFQDPDTPYASSYFYKDSDSVDPLIYAGPVWDYDRAIGEYGANRAQVSDPQKLGYYGVYAEELLQHTDVLELVKTELQETFAPYVEEDLRGNISDLADRIGASAEMNRIRWNEIYGYYTSYDNSLEFLGEFMETRKDFLEEVWLEDESFHTVTFLDSNGEVCEEYHIRDGEYLTEVPQTTSYTAFFTGWYAVSTGEKLDIRKPILEDVTFESHWFDAEMILTNTLSEEELMEIDPDALETIAAAIRKMQEEAESGQ